MKTQRSYRILPETKEWIKRGAKARGLGVGEFLDVVATWPVPGSEAEEVREKEEEKEKVVTVAEELELSNGLLKITRDEDGLPVAFVRSKPTEGWKVVDWKRLRELDVEVQGLKRDKLQEEVKRIRVSRLKMEGRLTASERHTMNEEEDRAEVPNWCRKCRVTIETRAELQAHTQSCGVNSLEYVQGMPEVR